MTRDATMADTALYDALVRRDPAYDGRAFVAVLSTGIFCRLTCAARKPRRENCRFFETAKACLDAGFRPCKRCSPMRPAADSDPLVRDLLSALEAHPDHRWRETDVAMLGYDPSTVRRAFKRHFGLTFLDLARHTRLRSGFQTLSDGGRVIDAQVEAGFDSGGGFRTAFARLMGCAPADMTGRERLKADWIDTPLGAMIAVADRDALYLLEFIDRKALPRELANLRQAAAGGVGTGRTAITDQIETELAAYFVGRSARFTVPIAPAGSAFARSVWAALRRIPPGETRSYADIARELGRPAAVRAVARANGANRLALVIPCHRVIGSDGSLTGYGGGLWRKQSLIDLEQRIAARISSCGEPADRPQSAGPSLTP